MSQSLAVQQVWYIKQQCVEAQKCESCRRSPVFVQLVADGKDEVIAAQHVEEQST